METILFLIWGALVAYGVSKAEPADPPPLRPAANKKARRKPTRRKA